MTASYVIYVQTEKGRSGRCRQRLVARGETERLWDAVAAVLTQVPDVQPADACAYGAIYHTYDDRPLRGWRNPMFPQRADLDRRVRGCRTSRVGFP